MITRCRRSAANSNQHKPEAHSADSDDKYQMCNRYHRSGRRHGKRLLKHRCYKVRLRQQWVARKITGKPALPSRLHAVETVFAMTVHKSQGSEFLHTALLLPPTLNPILTRELVYTGITRAREWLTVVEAKRGVLNEAVTREFMRVSGWV